MSIIHSLLAGVVTNVYDVLPRVIPADWKILEKGSRGAAYRRADGLQVLASVDMENDNKRWYHVSCSRQDRLPSWEDLGDVKNLFVGDNRTAYQVFPRKEKYVNVHPFCLHLWCCLDGDPLPDFAHGGLI